MGKHKKTAEIGVNLLILISVTSPPPCRKGRLSRKPTHLGEGLKLSLLLSTRACAMPPLHPPPATNSAGEKDGCHLEGDFGLGGTQ